MSVAARAHLTSRIQAAGLCPNRNLKNRCNNREGVSPGIANAIHLLSVAPRGALAYKSSDARMLGFLGLPCQTSEPVFFVPYSSES